MELVLMTKKQKEFNNRYALDLWNMCKTIIQQQTVVQIWSKRLAYCRATVTAYAYKGESTIYILTSYSTPVACVIVNSGCVYGVDMIRYEYGYTATSAKHIAKFFNHYVDYVARTRNKESLRLRYYA